MKQFVIKVFGVFLFILFCFISCENFHNGFEVRKQIEASIAYNNAPSFIISFNYPESSGVMRSPSGSEISKKVTDSFTVWFDPLPGYEFVSWKIIDSATKTEIKNGEYLTLENIDQAQTTCSFTKAPEKNTKLCLSPVIAERPQIIFNSPVSLSTLKDSRIQVRFDHDMDPYSIYFTQTEIDELKNKGIADTDFLPPLDDTQQNHYGYKKDDKVFFKNITIQNEKTGENLNHCFDAPEFENTRALSIAVKDKNSLEDFTPVLVTIEKGFFYTEKISTLDKGKPVEMSEKKTWMYQVNAKTDKNVPIVPKQGNEDLFSLRLTDGTQIKTIEWLNIQNDGTGINDLTYVKDNKLYLDFQIQDENGSGPAPSFKLYATKIFDGDYNDIRIWGGAVMLFPVKYANPYVFDFQTLTSDSAIFNGTLDLSVMNLDDGIYWLYCTFTDKSGNEAEYPIEFDGNNWYYYYFAIDNEFSMPEPEITYYSDTGPEFKISWTPCIDLAKTIIRYKKQNETSWSEPDTISHGTNIKYITGLDLATTYDFEITYYDYAGHEQLYTLSKTTDVWRLFVSGKSTKTIYFEGDDFVKDGINVLFKNLQTNEEHVLNTNNWQVEFDTQNIGLNKKALIKYDNNGLTYCCETPGVYHVAAKDSLTENITMLEDWSFKFGDFPQTISAHQEASYYTDEPVYPKDNPLWYLGADGYFYEKCIENAYKSGLTYTDGSTVAQINQNSYKYFKVEPIKWTNFSSNQIQYLVSNIVVTGNIQYYLDNENRTISGQTVYPNNYQYSTLRAYLNGSYEENDTQQKIYENSGFLQKAFTPAAQALITERETDNSTYSTKQFSSASSVTDEMYLCNNTVDKIFALSESVASSFYNIFNNSQITDYAKANYAIFENDQAPGGWLRTPSNTSTTATIHSSDGSVRFSYVTERQNVLPAVYITDLPE